MEKQITVLAAESLDHLQNDGCSVEQECETVSEAKNRAKYYLTEAYMLASESTTMIGYSQVRVNGVCVYDYFGK